MAPPDPQRAPRPHDRIRSPLGYGRETVESLVVAFTIALLFRAFEAEAFVIPTGSMAPTLMGRHKDLVCNACGLGYQVGCSAEEDDQSQGLRMELARLEQELATQRSIADRAASTPREREAARQRIVLLESDVGPIAEKRERLTSKLVARARCPNCGYVTQLLRPRAEGMEYDPRYPSFSGDRIVVDKFSYDYSGPQRWDVVVFRYPEDAKVNYIKRDGDDRRRRRVGEPRRRGARRGPQAAGKAAGDAAVRARRPACARAAVGSRLADGVGRLDGGRPRCAVRVDDE
jgi:signal peptidase I